MKNDIINLRLYVDEQLTYFISLFKENNWKQEDLHYVSKRISLQDHPLGIVFYSKLLEYSESNKGQNYLNMLTPWIVGRIEIEETDNLKIKEYAKFILEETDKMGINLFHDEDAYYGYFSLEKNKGWSELKFYMNKHYPNGYWENHTL